jgi:NAD(P)-dependent dehydrogenase (short-subunit alcohol dehydrogenase family)
MTTEEKVVVIGGTNGMGLATVQLFAKSGYDVIFSGRSAETIEKATKELPTGKGRGLPLSYGNTAQIQQFFAEVGPFDHLLLVGSSDVAWGPFASISMDKFKQALNSKLVGYAEVTQAALPTLRQGGSITYVTGGASRQAIPGTAFLAAVNGGIVCMATTLAKELAPTRVNVLSPGMVETPAYDYMGPDAKKGMLEAVGSKLPVGRVGQPPEIAEALLFLVRSGFTTGAVLDIDGGARMQ